MPVVLAGYPSEVVRDAARIGLVVGVLAAAIPSVAFAESGKLNLHLEGGFGQPFIGRLAPPDDDRRSRLGPGFWAALDMFPNDWIAFEALVGLGYQFELADQANEAGAGYWCFALGARARWLDDMRGYGDDIGGDLAGNFWVSAHVGYHNLDDVQFGLDVGAGYEISWHRPWQIGPFVRTLWLFGGRADDADAAIFFGIGGSLEITRRFEQVDTDRDGLPDVRETELGTDAGIDDTDRDGILDGVEVRTRTNPLSRDSDSDGLEDGTEDVDRDGIVDAAETDPRRGDTDRDGVPDADERYDARMNPRGLNRDRDGDGVDDEDDACPGSPRGAEVGQNGCAILAATFEMRGIEFRPGSARIAPESEPVLQRLLEILDDNPTVRIEITGHTDNQGNRRRNIRLSEQRADAVRRWLVRAGVRRNRIETAGRGPDNPVADNDTEEGRARNRRIEIRRLDTPGPTTDDSGDTGDDGGDLEGTNL